MRGTHFDHSHTHTSLTHSIQTPSLAVIQMNISLLKSHLPFGAATECDVLRKRKAGLDGIASDNNLRLMTPVSARYAGCSQKKKKKTD